MSNLRRASKRLAVWAIWGIAGLLVLQACGQFMTNRWLVKKFGPGAGTFKVQIWRLGAISPKGSLEQKETKITWENLDLSLFSQTLLAGSAELVYQGKPLAEARQLRVDHLFGVPCVRTERMNILPDTVTWRGMQSAWASSKDGGGTIPSFTIWLPAVEVQIPGFSLRGSTLFCSSEGGIFTSATLSCDKKAHLELQGHVNSECGELFITGDLFQSKIEVVGSKDKNSWRGIIGYQRAGVRWEGDFGLQACSTVQILLRNATNMSSKEWLFLSLPYGMASPDLQPTLQMSQGGISAASIGFSELPLKNRINIAVEVEANNKILNGKQACISAVVFADVGDIEKGTHIQQLVNLNWRVGEQDRLSVSATLPSSIITSLPNILKGATAGGEAEGLLQPKTRFVGSLNSRTMHLQLHGEGQKGNYEALFEATLPWSSLTGKIWWHQERWGGVLKGDFLLPQDTLIPLPSGTWAGEAQFEGKGGAVEVAELQANDLQGGKLACRYGANALTMGYSGNLAASWGQVIKANCDAKIAIEPNPFSVNAVYAEIKAERAQAGELALANLAAEIEGKEVLNIVCQTEFPELQGTLGSRWKLPLRSPSGLAMSDGHLELQGGRLKVEGLNAQNLFENPKLLASWNAEHAWIEGEPVDSLKGEVTRPAGENIRLTGTGQAIGGKMLFEIASSAQGDALKVQMQRLDAPKAVACMRRFVPLPFAVVSGTLDGSIEGPLAGFGPGWKIELHPNAVTFQVPDERHQLRDVDGLLRLAVQEEGIALSSEALTLEKGRIPLGLEGLLGDRESSLLFTIPPAPASEVQNALFDFLPEFVGYGTFKGKLGLEGHFEIPEREPLLRVRVILPDGGSFRSEDGSLVLEGMQGDLSLSVPVGDWGAALKGYAAPGPGGRPAALDRFTTRLLPGDLLTVEHIRYSVFSLSDATLSSSDGADGVTRIRLTEGRLWDGLARGEFALAVDRDDIRYGGQLLLDRASLKAFCAESDGVTGYIGGRVSTSLTFGADRLGLGALKAVVELEADPKGGEPLLLGRDFLVKIGGSAMERLVKQEFQPYDKALLKVGVHSGNLSVQSLVLEHQADPFSALFKRDLSYELRMPASNSISLYRLLDLVKGLETTTASVNTKMGTP